MKCSMEEVVECSMKVVEASMEEVVKCSLEVVEASMYFDSESKWCSP